MKANVVRKSVDEYIAAVPEPGRSRLNKLRAAIRSAVPPETTSDVVEIVEISTIGGAVCASAKLNTNSMPTTSMRILQPLQHNSETDSSVHILRIASESDRPDRFTTGDDVIPSVILVRVSIKDGIRGEAEMCSTLKSRVNAELLTFFKQAAA